MKTIYIAEAYYHDYECSWHETIRAFEDKETAKIYILECETDAKECMELMKEFDKETYNGQAKFIGKLGKRKATEEDAKKHREYILKRQKEKEAIKVQWAKEGRFWYEGGCMDNECPSFEVNELELVAG